MKCYTVKGIKKANSADVTLKIPAESEANARAKAEIQEIVVTEVKLASENVGSEPSSYNSKNLNPGESIVKGYCINCGEVPVKITRKGYHPRWYGISFHLFLMLITAGGWVFIWIGWAFGCHIFRQGERRCMACGQLLQKG